MSETTKRGRGRPPLPDARRHAVVIRVTDAEREELFCSALRAGLPLAEFLRRGAGLTRGDAGASPATSRRAS
ncbi:MAG TPA: hypothetical protein VGM56_08740 [Byssovorax sp.]